MVQIDLPLNSAMNFNALFKLKTGHEKKFFTQKFLLEQLRIRINLLRLQMPLDRCRERHPAPVFLESRLLSIGRFFHVRRNKQLNPEGVCCFPSGITNLNHHRQ